MSNDYKWTIYVTCYIISIGGLLLGISANVSGAVMYFSDYFNLVSGSIEEGITVSITMLSTFIGNFYAGKLGNAIGRKKSLIIAAIFFVFCTLGSALSTNYYSFLINRFIGGLGIGISLLIVPLYIAELAPAKKRGILVSFNQLNIGLGYLIAYMLNYFVENYFTDPNIKWRWMLGIGVIFPIIYIIGLIFVPESPLWEQNKKNNIHYRNTNSYYIQGRILFKWNMRLILFISFSIAFFQMACGINSVIFYAPKVFDIAGFTSQYSFLNSNLIGICMVFMTFISMALIDRIGRKPLLIIGSIIMILSLLMVSISFYTKLHSYFILIGILCTVIGFAISLGPITWILLSEVFPFNVKGLGISLAGVLNGITSFIITTLFPIELKYLGAGSTFLIYTIVMILCLISIYLFYPETKGKDIKILEKELIKA